MNLLIWLAAATAGLFVIDAKVKPLGLAKINPLGSGTTITKTPTKEGPAASNPAATPTAPIPSVIPGIVPGVPVIDGHGTGVLPGLPIPSSNIPSGDPIMDAAKRAANALQLQIVDAMNTPAGDRTPEQLAILSSVAQLPTL